MPTRPLTWLASGRGLTAEAEALARFVAPDVASGPFYVVLRPDLPAEYQGGDGGALALTSRHLDVMLRPTLERQRRWRGRGPAILLDPVAIAAEAAHRPRSSRRRVFPAVAAGVVLHELAHVVVAGPREETEPDPGLIEFGRLTLAADLRGTETPTNGPGAAVPWRGHEWPFIRIALHLAHRAARLGVDVSATDVFDARDYELSPTHRYVAALGDEPALLAGRPITAISQVPPPAAFVALWGADVRAWNSQHETTHETSMTLAACGRRIPIPTKAQDAPPCRKERKPMLKELFSELETRRNDRELDFWATARKLAAGEKVTAAAVEKLLAESGKTPNDLQAAVELMMQRAQWNERRRRAAALEKEQAALKDRIAVEDKKLGDAESAHADATRPLYARLHQIKAAISDASDSRRHLIRTCPDAGLKAELASVTQRLIELRAQAAALRERGELVKQADREDEAARRMAEGIVPGTRTTRIDQLREQAARARKVGQEALAALPDVQKEIEKLGREEEAVYERMAKL